MKNVRFTPRALSEAEAKQTWWRENRPASPDLFDDELAEAIEQIRRRPTTGAVFPSRFDGVVRRVLLPKSKNHVYYTVEDREIVILSVWGAPRARGPRL